LLAETLLIFTARYRAIAAAAFVALAVSGCGRIGPLEPPPDPNAPPKPAQSGAASQSGLSADTKPKIPPIVPPHQPFILDPLLK
jgi:predicted small lipoprotein YifL